MASGTAGRANVGGGTVHLAATGVKLDVGKHLLYAEPAGGLLDAIETAHQLTDRLDEVVDVIRPCNATKCSTFEVQYDKSTSTRTTAIRHFRVTLTERVISRMRTN